MSTAVHELLTNRVFLTWVFACLISQAIKITVGLASQHRFDFRWLLQTGGMPSTHSAGVTATSAAIGLEAGFGSPLFAATLVFTIVTLFDAQGVRRWSGRQGQILNRMLEDIYF